MQYYIVMERPNVPVGSPKVYLSGPFGSEQEARSWMRPTKRLAREQDPTAKQNRYSVTSEEPDEETPVRFTQDKLEHTKARLESAACEENSCYPVLAQVI